MFLLPLSGSPFATSASSSGFAVANPDGTFLYNTENCNIEGFSIGANGALTSIVIFPITNAGSRPRGIVVY